MKNLTLIIALFLTTFSISQELKLVKVNDTKISNPWTLGAKAGLNIATLSGSYTDLDWVNNIDGILGFHLGGWANYAVSPKFSLQPEVLVSWQGGDINYNEIPNPIGGGILKPTGKMRLPYIMVPVMFQYSPMENLYVEVGPKLNYLPKVNINAFINGKKVEDQQAADLITSRLKNVKNFDVGINLGAGYEVVPDWTAYVRYTHGLMTIDNRENDQRDLKNRVFALGVAYKLK